MLDVVTLLRVVAHDLNRVNVSLADRLVINIVIAQLLLDAEHPATDRVPLHRVLEKLCTEMHHNHHVLQIGLVGAVGWPRHSRILVENGPMVLVHVEARTYVAFLLLTQSLLLNFLPVLDAR